MVKLKKTEFDGGAGISTGTLAAALVAMAQRTAAAEAIALSDLTADNSGGTSGSGTIAAVTIPSPFTSVGTDLFPKAGGETAFGTVMNGLATVLEKANAIAVAIGHNRPAPL